MKTPVATDKAPAAIGPYSQAIKANGMVFCSGQVGLDPTTMKLVEGGVEAQTRQVLDNLGAVLEAAGASFDSIVKTTIFLVTMDDYKAVNAIYAERFGEKPPARAAVAVAQLPIGAVVEIEAIALVTS